MIDPYFGGTSKTDPHIGDPQDGNAAVAGQWSAAASAVQLHWTTL
ncbi:MAG: hypothetical protein ABSD27_02975 [Bryobacteraceae bacterium]|jgi:hypothetical protein